jgi:hypothetical protein
MVEIQLATDFSAFPGGRRRADGPYSGEEFREKFLTPPLKGGERLTVRLDGAFGYPSSFLDEAFGGLIREDHFELAQIRDKLTLVPGDESYEVYVELIWTYISEAANLPKTRTN